MIKHYCDICGRLLNPSVYVNDEDPDDYTYEEIEVYLGEWFKLDDVCKGCADKYHKITKEEVMKYIRKKCGVESDES